MNRILLLEDDLSLIDVLAYSLKKNDFYIEIVRTVGEALKRLPELNQYDLLILDVTLPDGTDFEVCEKIRNHGDRMPIIFLTASDEEVNVIRGLDGGGDDYITKPFKIGELYSRIRTLLRRTGILEQSEITSGDLSISLSGSRATLKRRKPDLTGTEYRLLCLLVRSTDRIVTRDNIPNELWDGTGDFVEDNTLSVYIRCLHRIFCPVHHPFSVLFYHDRFYEAYHLSLTSLVARSLCDQS